MAIACSARMPASPLSNVTGLATRASIVQGGRGRSRKENKRTTLISFPRKWIYFRNVR
jgi:hypothetical protein